MWCRWFNLLDKLNLCPSWNKSIANVSFCQFVCIQKCVTFRAYAWCDKEITILVECQPLYLASIISGLKSQLLSNYEMNFVQGSQLFLTIKFKVISRFCPGKKSHSPGFVRCRQFWHQRQTLRRSKIPGAQNNSCLNIIEMLHILIFRVLSMFCAPFWTNSRSISGPGQIKFKSPGFPTLGTLV